MTVAFGIRLSPEELKQIEEIAEQKKISRCALIRTAVKSLIQENTRTAEA